LNHIVTHALKIPGLDITLGVGGTYTQHMSIGQTVKNECLGQLSTHALTKGCLSPAHPFGEAPDPFRRPGS
jgi:hypothetical protein